MAARPLPPLHVARRPLAAPEEPAQSSTRIKRSAGLSEDSEAAIQASLDAALTQLDSLELAAPRRPPSPTSSPLRTLPKGMPPLPRGLPPNMPPLPPAAKRPPPLPAAAASPPELLATAALAPVPSPRRRSAKPLAVALLLTLGVGAGAFYATPLGAQLSLSQLRAAVTHLLRP